MFKGIHSKERVYSKGRSAETEMRFRNRVARQSRTRENWREMEKCKVIVQLGAVSLVIRRDKKNLHKNREKV